MPSIRVSSTTRAAAPSQISGQWWLASDKSNQIGGVLDFDPVQGGILRLHGALVAEGSNPGRTVVLGFAHNHGRVTIPAAHYEGAAYQGLEDDERVTEERWFCSTVLLGEHLPSGGATTFRFATLQTSMLPSWVAKPRPTVSRGSGSEILEIETPKSLSAHLERVEVGLAWWKSGHHGQLAAEVSVEPTFTFTAAEPITLDSLFRHYVIPTLSLITLATGHPDAIRELSVHPDVGRPHERCRVLIARRAVPEPETSRWWDFGVPFADVEPKFDEFIRNWFAIYAGAQSAFLDFFSTYFTPDMYVDERFNRVVRSVELFHRSRYGGTQMDPHEYESLVAKATSDLSDHERSLLGMRLRYGNELTQKQRLDDMINRAGKPVVPLINKMKRFSRRVIDARNEMTHGGSSQTAPLDDGRLAWATSILEVVFFAVLLTELGFADSEAERLVGNSGLWRDASHVSNPWVAEALSD